jgi:TP901 family phage tail tape measure protein
MPEPIGVAFVEIVPETSAFAALTTRQLASQLSGARVNVPVGNVAAATARLEGLAAAQAGVTAGAEAEGVAAAEATAALTAKAAAEERASFFTRLHTKSAREASEAVLAETATVTGLRGASIGVNPVFLAATAAAIAFFKSGEEADQFREQMHLIQFATEATSKEMEQAANTAVQLGHDLSLPGSSALDAARAIEQLTHSGFDLVTSEKLARDALLLTAASQVSLADSTDILTRLLRAYNLDAAQATEVSDTLTAATLSGAGSTQEWASALQQLAPLTHSLGFDIHDTATLLIQAGAAGLTASQGATLLRLALVRLAGGTKPVVNGLKQINDLRVEDGLQRITLNLRSLHDAEGNLRPDVFRLLGDAIQGLTLQQQGQALAAIFGARAGARLLPIINQTGDAYRTAAEKARRAGLTQKEAEDRTKSLGGQSHELKKDLSDLGVAAGHLASGPMTLLIGVLRIGVIQMQKEIEFAGKLAHAIKNIPGPSGIDVGRGAVSFLGNLIDKAGGKGPAAIERLAHSLHSSGSEAEGASEHYKHAAASADGVAFSAKAAAAAVDHLSQSFKRTGDTELAFLQATGASNQAQLAQLRKNEAQALRDLGQAQIRSLLPGAGPKADAAVRAAADRVSAIQAQIESITGQIESTAKTHAAATKKHAAAIIKANNQRDQNIIDAIGGRENVLQDQVAAAADKSLTAQIKAEQHLRHFYDHRALEMAHTIKNQKDRAAEIQRLTLLSNAAEREVERLQKERVAKQKEVAANARQNAIEAAQLDEQILETQFGDTSSLSSGQRARLVAAHKRVIDTLIEARKHTRSRSVEYKRLTLEI